MIFCWRNGYIALLKITRREKIFRTQKKTKTYVNVFTTTATIISDSSKTISTELDLKIWCCFF